MEPRFCLSAVAFVKIEIGSAPGASSIFAADLDQDGDVDVLFASHRFGGESTIGWYENTDGAGAFGPAQVITNLAISPSAVYAADLDGDGNADVLSASSADHTIAWYENTDGAGSFGVRQIISTSANTASSVHAADLDGDGDLDVLSASFGTFFSNPPRISKISWYENMDGTGRFSDERIITTAVDGANFVHTADLDGDGDQDVLAASIGDAGMPDDNAVSWYENTDGVGNFGDPKVISDGQAAYPADLDGDGDIDIISAASSDFQGYVGDSNIVWFENNENDGNFTAKSHVILSAVEWGTSSVFAADLDGDGDLDVLTGSLNGGKVAWYENTDGVGDFGAQRVIATGMNQPTSIFAVDVDGDGDMDVLSSSFGGEIAWYENRHVGDSNNDGVFDSSDLVAIFMIGKYEDSIPNNATFDEGDWNQDGDFTSADLVFAFQAGTYVTDGARAASELAAAVDWLLAQDDARKSRAFLA
jgi:hypothetical protein